MRVFSSVAAAAALIAIAAPGAAQTGSMSGMAMPTCPASSPVVWENTKTHVFSTRSQVGFGVAPGRAVCRSVAVRAGYRAATSMTSRSLGAGSSTPGGSSYNKHRAIRRGGSRRRTTPPETPSCRINLARTLLREPPERAALFLRENRTMTVYEERRAALASRIGDGVAVIPSATLRIRNNDAEYEFRQNSDFFYLTGFNEPDAVLVIAPNRKTERVIMFLRTRDRSAEIWTGKRLGVEAAPEQLGIETAYPIDEFDRRLPDYFVGSAQAFYSIGRDEVFDRRVMAALAEARHRVRRGGTAPTSFVEPGTFTRLGHIAGMRATHPGMPEYELEALIEYTYRRHGAQDVAYSSIVAGADNATILHYNTNREILAGGALVLVDSAAELDCYAADVTRTWPVNGRFTSEQRAIYEIVLAAQKASIAQVRPGNSFRAYHDASVRVITEGLIDLGLIEGPLDTAIEQERYTGYFMHNTGHWLGLDVHDVSRRDRPVSPACARDGDDGRTRDLRAPGSRMRRTIQGNRCSDRRRHPLWSRRAGQFEPRYPKRNRRDRIARRLRRLGHDSVIDGVELARCE